MFQLSRDLESHIDSNQSNGGSSEQTVEVGSEAPSQREGVGGGWMGELPAWRSRHRSLVAFVRSPVLFPDRYAWYVLVCFLDLIITNTMLSRFGGVEVNGIAHRIIEAAGFPGLIAYKAASIVLVVSICEIIGRRRISTARRLSEWGIALSAIPVVIGLLQIPFAPHQRVEPQPRAVVLAWVMPD